jgi:hypothetical protein
MVRPTAVCSCGGSASAKVVIRPSPGFESASQQRPSAGSRRPPESRSWGAGPGVDDPVAAEGCAAVGSVVNRLKVFGGDSASSAPEMRPARCLPRRLLSHNHPFLHRQRLASPNDLATVARSYPPTLSRGRTSVRFPKCHGPHTSFILGLAAVEGDRQRRSPVFWFA